MKSCSDATVIRIEVRRGDITRLFKKGEEGGENGCVKNPRLSKSGIGIFKEADYLRDYERRVWWPGEVKGKTNGNWLLCSKIRVECQQYRRFDFFTVDFKYAETINTLHVCTHL